MAPWGDPGVTEQQVVLEDNIAHPGDAGGVKTVTLQRAGYLRRLRLYLDCVIEQSAGGTAPVKSEYGPFGSMVRKLRIEAAGRQPLFVLSGLGATVFNEIQNRDGSILAIPAFNAIHSVPEGATLVKYTAPGTAAQTYNVAMPLEFQFSYPVYVRGVAQELGLWLLQDRSVDLAVEVEFSAPYIAGATPHSAYSGGATVVAPITIASSNVKIERELYAVPARKEDRPIGAWAHQVVEHEAPIAGKKFRFDVPAAGLLLRATIITLDSSDALVEHTDIDNISVIYGTNTTPIRRPGWGMVKEFVDDYGRMPPKGVVSLDFYKWGMDTLKLAKDSEVLANFRIEGEYTSTSTGKALIILDTLQRVLRQGPASS